MIGYLLLLDYNRFGFLFGINSVCTSVAILLKQNREIKYFLLSSNNEEYRIIAQMFYQINKVLVWYSTTINNTYNL